MPDYTREQIADLWEKARDAIQFRRQNYDLKWMELDAFDRGEQWTIAGQIPSWIPKPSTNFVSKVKRYKTGNLVLEDYLGELKPLAPENEGAIWQLQKFYEQIWDKLNMKYHILDVVRTSRLLGTGILYVGWDEAYIGGTRGHLYQGEILVKEIEPSTFFVDPTAFDLEEALYCGTFVRTTEDHIMMDPTIEDKYKKDFKERRRQYTGASGQEDRGEIYYNRDFGSYQDMEVVDLMTIYEKIPNDDGIGYSIRVSYIADGVLIKTVEELQPNLFPFIVLYQHKQRMDFWGISDCQLILPNVKMINKVQSIIGTLATLYQNPQKVVYEGSGIDPRIVSKYGNAFGLVLMSKSPDLRNAITNVDTADIPVALMNYIEFLKNDIEDFTGISQFATGASSGSIQTSAGINSMIQRSMVGEQDEFLIFERFLKKVTSAILLNAIEYYTDDRVMRMRDTNPNNDFEYEYVPFRADEFRDLAWDYSIDITLKMKNTQQSRQQIMQMLSEWQLQYSPGVPLVTAADIVKAFNPPNRDVILARIEQQEQQMDFQMAAQLTQIVLAAVQAGQPPEAIAQLIYQTLNPEQQQMGNVQRRQQGMPGQPAQPMSQQ
jgi:hypothetical protein